MTAPRQVLAGSCYLVTRRCAHRQFLLRPSRTTNEIFRFVLALAARRFGVRIHAFCVLSNHYHLVVTDPDALLPRFIQLLDALVARALNASVGRWEDFWAPSSYSAVALLSPRDVVDKAAYTLANPVAAGLVRSACQWPGLWSAPDVIGAGPVEVRRPKHFFRSNSTLPESVPLELTAPPGFASAQAFCDELVDALALREAQAVRSSTGFLGVLKVLSQRPTARPRDREPRRGLSPRVASRDKWRRIEALGRLATFVSDYREALSAWHHDRAVLFPAGTFLMRVLHGAACAGSG